MRDVLLHTTPLPDSAPATLSHTALLQDLDGNVIQLGLELNTDSDGTIRIPLGGLATAAFVAGYDPTDVLLIKPTASEGNDPNEVVKQTLEPAELWGGQVTMHFDKWQVHVSGQDIKLTYREFKLLQVLAEHIDLVLTRQQIYPKAWETEYVPEYGTQALRTIDIHITRLRKKLGPVFGKQVRGVRSVGYGLDSQLGDS